MQIKDQITNKTLTTYSVAINQEELIRIKKDVLVDTQKSFKVTGFRPGKAPIELVEKNIDQTKLENEVINQAINEFYLKSADQLKLRSVGEPKISLTKFVPYTELEFKVEQETISDIKLGDYTKIKIDVSKKTVSESDLKKTLDRLAQRNTSYKVVNRASKINDRVSFDFDGIDSNGQKIDQASATNFQLVLGSNTFIPGFEENMIGLKKDAKKEFKLTFPENYHEKSFQNKEITFKVKVNQVEEGISEPISDNNVSTFGPFKTVQEFKDEIKKQLEYENEALYQRQVDDLILTKLAEIIEVTVPGTMIENETKLIKEDDTNAALSKGQTFTEYLKSLNLSEQKYQDNVKELATKRIKSGLALSEIAKNENISLDENEIEQRVEFYKNRYNDPQSQEQMKSQQFKRDVEIQLLTEKTLSLIKSKISK